MDEDLILDIPLVDNKNRKENKCFNCDANDLVKRELSDFNVDLVYIGPHIIQDNILMHIIY